MEKNSTLSSFRDFIECPLWRHFPCNLHADRPQGLIDNSDLIGMKGKKVVKKKKIIASPKKKVAKVAKKKKPLTPAVRRKPKFTHYARSHDERGLGYYTIGFLAVALGLVFFYVRQHTSIGSSNTIAPAVHSVSQSRIPAEAIREPSGPLAEEFKGLQNMSFQERLKHWSAYIEKNREGRKKIISQVAGQEVNDTAPIVPEEYDCTTFVETVAALSRSKVPQDLGKNILAIRYKDGQPSFENRNHFPEADWIPNNERAKILTDVTQQVAKLAGVQSKEENKTIDRGKWLAAQMNRHEFGNRAPAQVSPEWKIPKEAKLSYIPIQDIKKVLNDIPSGTILNLVHKNDDAHPVLITHQGLVIRDGNRVLLRHASTGGHIRTSDLYPYLHSLELKQNRRTRWPLIGVNLNQINDSASASNFLSDAK